MRIVIDLTPLDDNFSGIERFALNIAKNMIKQDQLNDYVLIFKNKIHKEFLNTKDNVECIVLKGKNRLVFNQITLMLNLYRIKADKYLFLSFPSPLLFFSKKITTTIHDLTCFLYPDTMNTLSKIYFRISIYKNILCKENIVTVSESSKKDIIKKFGDKLNIRVIYNGISENFLNQIDKEQMIIVKDKYKLPDNYILSVSTLEPRKNLKFLINTYINLKEADLIDEDLVLVGRKGWKFDDIFDSSKAEILNKYVKFTGFVEDEDLPYIYANANIFVFPSIYEGFGIPIIESIAMNTNVLTSNIPTSIEVTNNLCTYFDPFDEESLKSELLNYVSTPSELLTEHIKKYNWSTSANDLISYLCKGDF